MRHQTSADRQVGNGKQDIKQNQSGLSSIYSYLESFFQLFTCVVDETKYLQLYCT